MFRELINGWKWMNSGISTALWNTLWKSRTMRISPSINSKASMDCTTALTLRWNLELALKSGIDNHEASVEGAPRRRSKELAEINLSQSEVDCVIARQSDLLGNLT